MQHSAVSVANTATQLLRLNQSKAGWIIANNGSVTVFIGGSGVTTANGLPLAAGEKMSSDGGTEFEGDVYGIVASGTCDTRVLEWGEGEI